jgi:AcrR family transcriptional regulator
MVGTTRLFPYKPRAPREPTTEEKIRDAALTSCAQSGIAGMSFRAVADIAGVSVGAVQHHYRTKADLIADVDNYVLQVLGEALDPVEMPESSSDALVEAGQRLTRLMADNPRVFDYVGRALADGDAQSEFGKVIFDGLIALSEAQGEQFAERGANFDDLDYAWAVLNPIILRAGAIILRPHIERYLRQPFYTNTQLQRWDSAVTRMLRHDNGAFGRNGR